MSYYLVEISGLLFIAPPCISDTPIPAGDGEIKAQQVVDALNASHRPNVEFSDGTVRVCWNDHEKGEKCDYETVLHYSHEKYENFIKTYNPDDCHKA